MVGFLLAFTFGIMDFSDVKIPVDVPDNVLEPVDFSNPFSFIGSLFWKFTWLLTISFTTPELYFINLIIGAYGLGLIYILIKALPLT